MRTASARIAEFATGLRFEELPEATVAAAKLHALDALGCGLAGLAAGEGAFVLDAGAEVASGGPATAIGFRGGMRADDAALINGTLCHVLDYDDTHPEASAFERWTGASSKPSCATSAAAARTR